MKTVVSILIVSHFFMWAYVAHLADGIVDINSRLDKQAAAINVCLATLERMDK